MIVAARAIAARTAAAMEAEIATGRLTAEALSDFTWRPVPGTDPQPYGNDEVASLERLVPPIIEPPVAANPRMLF